MAVRTALAPLLLLATLVACATGPQPSPPPSSVQACSGAWRLSDGRGVTATPIEGGLRWRTLEGETGRLVLGADGQWHASQGGAIDQGEARISFSCPGGMNAFDGFAATAVQTAVVETVFPGSGGVRLAGRLILPAGSDAVPVMVQVHGSEQTSARVFDPFQQLLPLQGVGVFVYDKRGTGGSEGRYTQDFDVLAEDAAAAAREARRLAGVRLARLGLHGASQGGWVAPLAASGVAADFLIVSYGLLESPLEENRAQTILGVREAGFGLEEQAAAGDLADAAGAVMASGFRDGFGELEVLRREHREAPWFTAVKGEFTAEVLRYPPVLLRVFGPLRSQGTSWRHQGEPVLRELQMPVLWILAGEDREAPPQHTRSRLATLIAEGRQIHLAEFAGADHGMRLVDTATDGSRRWKRYAAGYFSVVGDFAHGRRLENTGAALVTQGPAMTAASQVRPN
ncbi:serine aminopeptidase domain-containing protein [Brevundimonas sp.]|uniref:alpha/beta hydrolase family protein n=1 Tax=Brevundimonas sp. TaxID=1871086 RepID=UPI00286AA7E3|nr:alpha/beta hydrolase [Brevundimonas sp.]